MIPQNHSTGKIERNRCVVEDSCLAVKGELGEKGGCGAMGLSFPLAGAGVWSKVRHVLESRTVGSPGRVVNSTSYGSPDGNVGSIRSVWTKGKGE